MLSLSVKKVSIGLQMVVFVTFYLCLFFLLGSCNGSTKKVISKNKNGSVGVVYELPNKNDTLNFSMKIYYPDGKLQREALVVNGKYTGKIITYWQDGKTYQVDSLNQPCDIKVRDCDETLTRYNKNGTLSQIFSVKKGSFNGLSKHYNVNGVLVKAYNLINDSIKDGDYKEFFDNGKVQRQAFYRLDTLDGMEYFFKENGDTIKYTNYSKGIATFPLKRWLEDDTTLEGNFVDEKGTSVIWKWYSKRRKEIRKKFNYSAKGEFIVPE